MSPCRTSGHAESPRKAALQCRELRHRPKDAHRTRTGHRRPFSSSVGSPAESGVPQHILQREQFPYQYSSRGYLPMTDVFRSQRPSGLPIGDPADVRQAPRPAAGVKKPSLAISTPVSQSSSSNSPSTRTARFSNCSARHSTCSFKRVASPKNVNGSICCAKLRRGPEGVGEQTRRFVPSGPGPEPGPWGISLSTIPGSRGALWARLERFGLGCRV